MRSAGAYVLYGAAVAVVGMATGSVVRHLLAFVCGR